MAKVEINFAYSNILPRQTVRQIVTWCKEQARKHLQEPDVEVIIEAVDDNVVNLIITIEGPEHDGKDALELLLEDIVRRELRDSGLSQEVRIGSIEVNFTKSAPVLN